MNTNKTTLIPLALTLFVSACAAKDVSTGAPTAEADPAASAEPAAVQGSSIVDVAVADGNFTTLVAALQAAGLDEALSGEGPFTVFAPTDEAFGKLPEGTVDALLADTERLTAVLTYHVVEGRVMAADVAGLQSATSLSGKTIAIDTSAGVRVGAATVVAADIEASNGVIHVIDTVLIPE